jgi:ATP-dependent Clp protease ATP-binding subunit ClpA
MFERFTERARRVVVLAQEEARELDHDYIGTEHILLGLLREGNGMAARALDGLGISRPAVRDRVVEMIGRGERTPSGHIPFTPRAKKALELSLREALQLGHNYIGTEHILLGLIREGEGVAALVLADLGADLASVRAKVLELVPAGASARLSEPVRPLRTGVPGTVIDGIIRRLDAIAERLDAIEHQLRLTGTGAAQAGQPAGPEAAGADEAAGPDEPAGGAGGETGAPPSGEAGTGG